MTSIAYAKIEVNTIFDNIVQNSSKSRNFIEVHSETFFTNEIISTGIVSLSSDGVMSKYIHAPKKSESHITEETLLLINNEGKEKSVIIANYPVLASSVNVIKWLLLGDVEKIASNYAIEYLAKTDKWEIELVPKDEEVLAEIPSILIKGHLGIIDTIKLIKSNGADVTTTFSDL